MNTLYHTENFQLSKSFDDIAIYLSSEAMNQSLHDIENHLFKSLLKIGKILLNDFITTKGTGKKDCVLTNEGEKLPFHELRTRKYLSIFGDINITRAYYWKSGIPGLFPFDAELNLPVHHHSYLLDKWIQCRITEEPYEQAIESICDLLDQKVSKRTVQQITSEASQEVENYYSQKTNFEDEGSHLIAQVDCKGVIMIPKERPKTKSKEGFVRRAKGVSKIGIRKDAVVTTDYSIDPIRRTPKELLEGLMRINSDSKNEVVATKKKKVCNFRNKQVAGTMFGKEKAFQDLANRLEARDPQGKKPIFILIDGAHSLEKGFKKEFEKRGWQSRVQGYCLDIVHATEYLWDASTALYGETSLKRVNWVRSALLNILNSKVKMVIKELNQKIASGSLTAFVVRRLQRTITYFENHTHMMDYKRYLKDGYPIASGAIEGACNTLVKDRTDRSGMQWTKKGAAAVINLRSVKCNKDWSNYWDYYVGKQNQKLYGRSEKIAA
jgi:23S rRNA pseudoU1915 N3-methylase RlmH